MGISFRLEEYGASDKILFTDRRPAVSTLYTNGDLNEVNRLLDTCGDMLIEEENTGGKRNSNNAVDFRKLEIIKLALELL